MELYGESRKEFIYKHKFFFYLIPFNLLTTQILYLDLGFLPLFKFELYYVYIFCKNNLQHQYTYYLLRNANLKKDCLITLYISQVQCTSVTLFFQVINAKILSILRFFDSKVLINILKKRNLITNIYRIFYQI